VKIFAAGISTETNTFSPLPTALEDFLIQRGSDAPQGMTNHSSLDLSQLWGVLAAQRGDDFIFSLNAWAQPAGMTLRSAYERLRDEILEDLRRTLPVDIVLLMLHGAMVADGYDDCESDMIRRVRQLVGGGTVIAVELDLHCHLHEAKIADADIVITYKEYPHTDVNERAAELFNLAIATRLGEVRPTMALYDCSMVGCYPTSRQPMRDFVDAMCAAERRPGVLSVSFGHGFQFADLPHVGAKMLVVADANERLARQVAEEFGSRIYALRQQIGFDSLSLPMEEALQKAVASKRLPVVVADQSDNAGGGAPGDATFALRWLLERGVAGVAAAIVYDPEVVRVAGKAGVGARLSVRLGGKVGAASGAPLDLEASVLAMRNDYMHALPQASGQPILFRAGNVVALHCAGIDIVVSSERCQCCSPLIFTDLGIDPASKHLLLVKSMQHFYGAFAPIAGEVIYMSAPGAVAPDPRLISYRRLDTTRRYPWVSDPRNLKV
jgi:microcystin degradation protein MlrC